MNKKISTIVLAAMAAVCIFTSCSDSDKNEKDPNVISPALLLDYTAENAEGWGNYMVAVASLLQQDATTLYNDWTVSYEDGDSYADLFKNHNNPYYPTAYACITEMLDACAGIADEVGGQKIGEPYRLYRAGKTVEALYAVESWFSHHSIDDYANNIRSIRNTYYGVYDPTKQDDALQPAEHSLANLIKAHNPVLDTKARELITATINAIESIPSPLRDHIVNQKTDEARTACATLKTFIEDELMAYVETLKADPELDAIARQFVDGVVIPTYKDLKEKNDLLYAAVREFQAKPSDLLFQKCADAWMNSRKPWETSEAFLLGPVDAKGLDPNMDSWPLDADGIVAVLESGKFDELEWTGEYIPEPEDDEEAASMTESDLAQAEAIAAKQNLRGFHTLEYLIFKDGKARSVNNEK